ncbi:MAG: hypothetical protein KAG66_16475, partial [Methylococcales bacterium]|nr:hypothetical protein [Methylococcales bacterium]
MIDLEALCVHPTKVTGIPARISSPIMNESNHRTNMSEVIHVMYHQLLSPDPDDLLLDSSQELGTDLVMVLKVVLVAAMSKYPAVGDTLLDAVAYYDPNLGGDES